MSACCTESNCKRRHPILVRRAPFSGRWVALTRYRHHGEGDRPPGMVEATEKHELPPDTQVEIELGSKLARDVFEFVKTRYTDAADDSEAEAAYRAVLDEFERVAHEIETTHRGPAHGGDHTEGDQR